MKKKYIFIFLLLIAGGFTRLYGQGYQIKGHINGITTGKVFLVAPSLDRLTAETKVDSAIINKGSFDLKGKALSPQMMMMVIEPGNWRFEVFVENKAITITADTTGSRHYDYSAYGMGTGAGIIRFTETGSSAYDDWQRYQKQPGQKQYDGAFAELQKKFKAAAKDIDAQYKVRDQMDSVSRLLGQWRLSYIQDYIAHQPTSVAGAYMFYQYHLYRQDMSASDLEAMLSKFSGEAKSSVYYTQLLAQLTKLKAILPGNVAPDFTLLRPDSSKLTMSQFAKGKYVMLDFWASWCHPCRKAIPHWKEVYQKYHSKGFDILSITNDSQWKSWKKAIDEEKMPWPQVADEFPVKFAPARVISIYMTPTIPFYVLLDKKGRIILTGDDEAKIDAKLQQLLGN